MFLGSVGFGKKLLVSAVMMLLTLPCAGCSQPGEAGQTAPDFSLKDTSGNKVMLRHYKGKVILLDFWATWCPPCKRSIPELVDLQRKYRKNGLVILGVSVDDPDMVNNRYLSAFKEKYKINYTILRANKRVLSDYFSTGDLAVPTLFVIDRQGKIVDKQVGFRPGAAETSIKSLL
jgi:peroxiredoxin